MRHVTPLCIEVRHSFSTYSSCKDILMSIDESVDTSLAQFVDKLINLIEVSIIIDTRCDLNSLPHHTESDEVESPLCELFNFCISQRELSIKLFLARDIRGDLVDNIDSMEND